MQYAERTQIDLVLGPTTAAFPVDTVVLYDPHGAVTIAEAAPAASGSALSEWAFLACAALADVGKYLRRHSAREVHARLGTARDQLWKLVAANLGVPDPHYGQTSTVDFAPGQFPAGMQTTVVGLDLGALAIARCPPRS